MSDISKRATYIYPSPHMCGSIVREILRCFEENPEEALSIFPMPTKADEGLEEEYPS